MWDGTEIIIEVNSLLFFISVQKDKPLSCECYDVMQALQIYMLFIFINLQSQKTTRTLSEVLCVSLTHAQFFKGLLIG